MRSQRHLREHNFFRRPDADDYPPAPVDSAEESWDDYGEKPPAYPKYVSPTAAFSGTPTTGAATLSVTFTDASTEDPTSWLWDFGDGGSSTTQSPSHDYTAPGTYTVTLTVANAYGQDVETKTDYITVS
jgi:PKD repeat protein